MDPSKPDTTTLIVQRVRPSASLRVGAVGMFVSAILTGLGVATGRVAESSVEQESALEASRGAAIAGSEPNSTVTADPHDVDSERRTNQELERRELERRELERRELGQRELGLQELWLQVLRGSKPPMGYDIARGPNVSQLRRSRIEHHSVFRWCGEQVEGLLPRGSTAAAAVTRENLRTAAAWHTPFVNETNNHSDGGVAVSIGALRSFDARPVRAVRTVQMTVTAYSPDERSCGASADGITASGYSVHVNGGCLVAADPKVLPLGSLVSVPGYDGGAVVPVLDTGGAIKGNRLDVLFPTHEAAMRWGRRTVDVTIWEYDDGLPNGFKRVRRASRSDT